MTPSNKVRVERAATDMEVSSKTIYGLIKAGQLSKFRQRGRTYVDAGELASLIAKRQAMTFVGKK